MSNLNNNKTISNVIANEMIFELKDKVDENTEQIAANLYEFKFEIYKIASLFEDNYFRDLRDNYHLNEDFDVFEKVEKKMSELFEKFESIKKSIHSVRIVKKYLEDKNKLPISSEEK